VTVGEGGDETPEIREPPGDRHGKTGRRDLVAALDIGERVVEHGPCVSELRASRRDPQPGRHDLVVERRLDHLDALVNKQLHSGKQVLLLGPLARRCAGR